MEGGHPMRTGAYLLALLAWSVFGMGTLPAADLDQEFLSKRWGAPLSDFPQFVHVGGSGKIAYYVNPMQAYTLFDTQVTNLVYGFYDEKFFAVYAGLEAIDTYSTIKRGILHRFGIPKISMEARGALTTHSWTVGETRIKMKYYETSGAMKLSFYYTPLAGRANAEMQREVDEEPPEPVFPLSPVRQKEALELLELFSN
jgi:hypothetical protein